MGEAFTFTCRRCSYAAEACGGTDSGREVTVTTATCSTCAEIVDVVVDRRGAPEIDDHDGRCPCCHGDALVAWGPRVFRPELTAEELGKLENCGPCPRCASAMRCSSPDGLMLVAHWD